MHGPRRRPAYGVPVTDLRFEGRIAGVGTTSGTRLVVGMWARSPLGSFADVMVETGEGRRILLAPSREVADFIAGTYTFDEVRVLPVSWRKVDGGIAVTVGSTDSALGDDTLRLRLDIGPISGLGMLLRLVPKAFATRPGWLGLINPVARLIVPGSATAGTAGGGRQEYYGVTLARHITGLTAAFEGRDLGSLERLWPPVRFGFGSAPAAPTLVDVTTTIR